MKRLKIVRVYLLDEPEIGLSLLNRIAPADTDTEAFEHACANQWEKYLKGVTVEMGEVILIGYNNGDVDVIITVTEKWIDAVDELRRWLDKTPGGDSYEIYWKFHGGSVRSYSKDF